MSSSAPPPLPPFYSSGQVREWSRSQWAGLASPINAIKIILLGHLQSPIFQVILDFVKRMVFFFLFIRLLRKCAVALCGGGGSYCKAI